MSATRAHRLALTLSPEIDSIISDYATFTGQNKTSVVTNLLITGVPALASALSLLRSGHVLQNDSSTAEVVRVLHNV